MPVKIAAGMTTARSEAIGGRRQAMQEIEANKLAMTSGRANDSAARPARVSQIAGTIITHKPSVGAARRSEFVKRGLNAAIAPSPMRESMRIVASVKAVAITSDSNPIGSGATTNNLGH